MRKTTFTALLLALATFGINASAQVILVPLSTFGTNGDGTLRPGEVPFLNNDGTRSQRGMAFNPATSHLIIANRSPLGGETLNVIDAATGAIVGELDQSSRTFGGSVSFVYNMVTVADDGAIYIGNLTTSGTLVEFILYRWASESSPQTVVYGPGNPGNTVLGNSRWGDTLTARGTGMDAEILLATQSGALAAILKPSVADFSVFTNAPLTAAVPSGGIGYALAFNQGNTFYGKGASADGRPLYRLSYDAAAGTTTLLNTYGLGQFPGRVGAISIQTASNLLAAIEMTTGTNADVVRLYDVSNPALPPVFQDRQPVPVWTNANGIFSGAIAFGNGCVYALDSDNGIAAFAISNGLPANLPPVIFGEPISHLVKVSSNTTFSVGADGSAPLAYQWLKNSSPIAGATTAVLALNNCQTTDAGQYTAVVTNTYGAVTSSVGVLNVIPTFGNSLNFDPFNYTVGSKLAGQGGWVLKSTVEYDAIEAGNLDVPGLVPSTGNRNSFGGGSHSVRWLFDPPQTNGAIWFSFALRVDTLGTGTGSDTTAGLAQGTTTAFPFKLNIVGNGAGTGYQLGLFKGGGTTGNGSLAPNVFTPTETVFVVGRYTFRSAATNDDTGDLWLNPSPATFGEASAPTPTLADQGALVTDLAFADGFMWRAGSAVYPKRVTDEFRLGFSWADVTPPGPPLLSVAARDTDAVLFWSTNTPPSFKLESKKGFDDVDGWQAETTSVVVEGNNYTVTVPADQTTKLFRLKK